MTEIRVLAFDENWNICPDDGASYEVQLVDVDDGEDTDILCIGEGIDRRQAIEAALDELHARATELESMLALVDGP